MRKQPAANIAGHPTDEDAGYRQADVSGVGQFLPQRRPHDHQYDDRIQPLLGQGDNPLASLEPQLVPPPSSVKAHRNGDGHDDSDQDGVARSVLDRAGRSEQPAAILSYDNLRDGARLGGPQCWA